MNADELLRHYERVADAPDAVPRLRAFCLRLALQGKLTGDGDETWAEAQILDCLEPLDDGKKLHQGWSPQCEASPSPSEDVWGVLRTTAIQDGYFLQAENKRLPYSLVPKPHLEVRPDDILLTCAGPRARCGIVCRVSTTRRRLMISGKMYRFRANRARILPEFLALLLRGEEAQGAINLMKTGSSESGLNLTQERFSSLRLRFGTLAEQNDIVAKVDELMALCDRLEAARAEREAARDRLTAATLARLNTPDPEKFREGAYLALNAIREFCYRPEQIQQLRRTILNLGVRGRLVPWDPNDPPPPVLASDRAHDSANRLDIELPANWRWVRVSDVAEARLGKMLDKAKNTGVRYPYLRNTNVHWFDVRLDDIKTIALEDREVDEYRLVDGDVLICEGGHGIGRTAVWRGTTPNMVFQKALHRVRAGEGLDPDFFSHCCFVYFDAGVMQTYFTGVGIPHFTGKALAQLVFPLPPIAEQRRIVAKVRELMLLCSQLDQSLVLESAHRKQLLEVLLSEALGVSAPEEAAA